MQRRAFSAAVLALTAFALVGLGATASAGWRLADRADLHVATSVEVGAGAGASAEWSAN